MYNNNNPCMDQGGKKQGIPLDWDTLFRNTDEAAPPQLVVVDKPNKRKNLPELRNGDDQEETHQRKFMELSDRQLSDAIERQKGLISSRSHTMPDRGEKLLRRIRLMEEEFERRRSEKDNVITRTENVFRNELSTLNRYGQQKLISDGHDLSARRRKGSLTLRQTQFISPANLSLCGDKNLLRKDDSRRRLFVTASPSCCKERVATECSDKRKSSEAQSCYDGSKDNTYVLVDLDEPDEAEMVPEVEQVDEWLKDSTIYYPSRYLQQSRSSLSEQADNYYFFNTYFYEKLKEPLEEENDNGSSFSKIRRWWKGVKLFEKSYIFLPIHEDSHWSLIIICVPEKEEGIGPIILHLDSLGYHCSKLIFGNIRRLLIGEWKFMVKEDPDPCLPFLRRIQENFHKSFEEMKVEVPQQRNIYDCGVFILFFIERFVEMAPKRMKKEDLKMFGSQWFKPAEASRLRVTIRKLLKDEFKRAKAHNCLLDA